MSQTEFAVPKDRQEVTVQLDDGQTIEGAVFLELSPNAITVHHRMVAFLEDESLFFPLKTTSGGTEFINKKNIKFIVLNYQAEREQVEQAIRLMQVKQVNVFFLDGKSMNGMLIAEVPQEKARLSDCLNLPSRFLDLKTDGRITYINKGKVRKVVSAPAS